MQILAQFKTRKMFSFAHFRGRTNVIEEVSGREIGVSLVTVQIEQPMALGAADL